MDIPDLTGRTFLVTGANTGIGRVTARVLAERGARVFVTARNEARARDVLDDIARAGAADRAMFLPLELGSLANVEACAEAFLDTDEPLHGLINNAGLGGHTGITDDGFEIQFGVNHLGHFLLTLLLLDKLKQSAPARIVHVSSKSHRQVRRVDLDVQRATKGISGLPAYCSSKLANVQFSNELARRLEGTGVTSCALHPGVIASDVWRRIPQPFRTLMIKARGMISVEQGAQTTLYCATAPELEGRTGGYFDDCREVEPSRAARDEAAAAELWRKSEAWVAAFR